VSPQPASVGDEEGVPELLAAQHVHQEIGRRVDTRQEIGQTEKIKMFRIQSYRTLTLLDFLFSLLIKLKSLEQACQTGGPRAAFGPFAYFVRPE